MAHTIIGLVGASGSGKSTLANCLVEDFGFHRFHIGAPLKAMLMALGLSGSEVAGSPEQRSAAHDLLCGKSVRFALSTLGTEWGRRTIGEDLWSRHAERRIAKHLLESRQPSRIVIDDLRYPSDWQVVVRLGGNIVKVRRPAIEIGRSWFDTIAYQYGIQGVLPEWVSSRILMHESEYHWRDAPALFEIHNTSNPGQVANAMIERLSSHSSFS